MRRQLPPGQTASASQRGLILGVIGLGMLLISASVASLNLALPRIALETGASSAQQTWIVDAYAVALASLLLPMGALGDRFGRREFMLLGYSLFAVSSIGAGLCHTPAALIVWRALAGVGAASMMPATLAIITTTFPENERGRAIGIWTALAGVGGVAGLLASGAILEVASWPAIFWMTGALAAVGLAAASVVIPASRAAQAGPLDPAGSALSITGFAAFVYGTIEGGRSGWLSGGALASLACAAVLLCAFVLQELRTDHPLLNVRRFTDRALSAGSISIALQFFVNFGMLFASLQWLELVKGYSALHAGAALLPLGVGLAALGPAATRLAARLGQNRAGALGLLILAVGTACLAVTDAHTPYLAFAGALVIVGAGIGLAGPIATSWIVGSFSADQQGLASAINDTTREVGGALGIAIIGSLITRGYAEHLHSYPAAIRQSLAAALQYAGTTRGGALLASAARDAWVAGQTLALATAAAAVLLGAVAVYVKAPRGREGRAAAEAGEGAVRRSAEPATRAWLDGRGELERANSVS